MPVLTGIRWRRSPIALLLLLVTTTLPITPTATTATTNQEVDENITTLTSNSSDVIDANGDFSHLYQVQMEFQAVEMPETDEQLEVRLKTLVGTAFNAAVSRHARLTAQPAIVRVHNDLTIQLAKRKVFGDHAFINFVTFIDGQAVLGEVITGDLGLLSSNMISAIMHYPLTRIAVSAYSETSDEGLKPWVVMLIISSGILLLACGWFILFVYFNTCGASRKEPEMPVPYQGEAPGLIIQPTPPWARGGHFHHALDTNQTAGVSPVQTTQQQPASSDAAIQTVEPPASSKKKEIDELLRMEKKERKHRKTKVEPSVSSGSSIGELGIQRLELPSNFDIEELFTPTTVDDGFSSSSSDRNIVDESLVKAGRPKSAGKQRHSIFETDGRDHHEPSRSWSAYNKTEQPGCYFNVNGDHPRPGEPTETGIIEIVQTTHAATV